MNAINLIIGLATITFGLLTIIFRRLTSKEYIKFIRKYYNEKNIQIFLIIGGILFVIVGIFIIISG